MGYFPVRYNSRVVNYDHRGFIRLATVHSLFCIAHLLGKFFNGTAVLNLSFCSSGQMGVICRDFGCKTDERLL